MEDDTFRDSRDEGGRKKDYRGKKQCWKVIKSLKDMTKRLKPCLYENLFCLGIRHKKRFSSKFEFKVILIYLYFYATCRVWSFWSTLWTPYPPSVKGSKIQVNLIKENRFVHEWSNKSSKSNFSSYIRQRVSFGLQCSFTALKNLTHHRVHSKIVPRYPK